MLYRPRASNPAASIRGRLLAGLLSCPGNATPSSEGIGPLRNGGWAQPEAMLSGEITSYVHGVFETEDYTLLILSVADIFDSPHLQPYLRQEG